MKWELSSQERNTLQMEITAEFTINKASSDQLWWTSLKDISFQGAEKREDLVLNVYVTVFSYTV